MTNFWQGFKKQSSLGHLNYLKRIGALGSKAGSSAAKRTSAVKKTTPREVLQKTTFKGVESAQPGARRYAEIFGKS